MSEVVSLSLEVREGTGSAYCGRLRKAGYLPCVVYGPAMKETKNLKVATKSVLPVLMSDQVKDAEVLLTLPCGCKKKAVIKSATKNYATDTLLHIDFYATEDAE